MGHEIEPGVGLRVQEQARFNRERFENLRSLTREDSWTHIETPTHITVVREILCVGRRYR